MRLMMMCGGDECDGDDDGDADDGDADIDGHEHLIQSAGLPLRQDAV